MTKSQKRALALQFLSRNDLHLQNAVLMLGGAPALWRLQRLRQSLAKSPGFNTGQRRGLTWLHRLLALEDIGQEGPMDMMFLNPADPAVHDICLLSESCARLMARLGTPGEAATQTDGQQNGRVAQINCTSERALPETEFRRYVQNLGGQVRSSD
ncbi:hypothetical protein [Sulfitobacter brevis]|nr:hypothetical protein [Sulfitobacter brevis]